MKKTVIVAMFFFLFAGCMSKSEKALRAMDLKAKIQHKQEIENISATLETSENFKMEGKAKFALVGKAPQQPFQQANIPDTGKNVSDTTKAVLTAGTAITAGALIHSAGSGGGSETTVINNGGNMQ